MNKKLKKIVIILIVVTLIIILIVSSYFIIKYFINKSRINNVLEIYSDDNVQKRLDNNDNKTINDSLLQIDGKTVLGVIKISQIGFEGLVYEDTSLNTLSKGVGHFKNTPYLEGNVCLAAHNTDEFWSKLHILKNGDKITYISFLGTKEYSITNVRKISETDWSLLQNTNENTLTLITCVKGEKTKRLCVTALENV